MSLPFADVEFLDDRKRNAAEPQDVLIRQREYAHDVAVVTFDYDTKVRAKYSHGAPVVIKWGWLPDDVEYFHGYVHHVEAHDATSKRKQLRVYCIGASYRMKEVRLRSFKKKKAHQVAAAIAKDHGLSLLAEHHAFVHDHLVQHGRSDWDFLVWLAKRIGYTFFCTKTDIVFVERRIDYRPSRNRPTFVFSPGRVSLRNGVYSLTHKVGENIPGTAKRKLVIQGVGDDGKPIKAVSKHEPCHTVGTHASTAPVLHRKIIKPTRTAAQAKELLAGHADLHRFHITGRAVLSGNTRVRQGGTIRVAGLDRESDGFWYVGQVDHHITRRDYRMTCELGRDALGDPAAPANGGPPVETSAAGKPLLLTDCDVAVDGLLEAAPQSIYNPVDDCPPVQNIDAASELTGPLPVVPLAPFASPARRRKAARKPVPTRRRGKCATPVKKPILKKKQKLTAWKAAKHVVRLRS